MSSLGGIASSAIGAFGGGGGGSSYNTGGPTGFGSAPIQTSGINFFG